MVEIPHASGDRDVDLRAGFLASPLFRELDALARAAGPYPSSPAKRHHLVPQFLLRRFASVRDGSERLVQLDVKSGQPQSVSPRTAASRTRFYRVTDEDGTIHQRIEAFLATVESHSAPAVRRLCEDAPGLSRPDRATLSYFFALLEGRTMGGLERIERLVHTTFVSATSGRVGDPETFAADYRDAIGPADDEEIERLRRSTLRALEEGRVKFANPKEIALELLLDHAAESAQMIYQLQRSLLHAEEGAFVTSDRGLAMHDPCRRFRGRATRSSAQSTLKQPSL